jgi:molecular chaperone DnaK (HSP70)
MLHLGIDFGTANTRVSTMDGPGRIPDVLEIAKGASVSRFIMPSSCVVTSDGSIEVGEAVLSRPGREKFVKRYWQQRPEDQGLNPWGTAGTKTIAGRTYTCEQMVEAVIAEAMTRAFSAIGADPSAGFTANIVCPVAFDLKSRSILKNILSNRGAQSVTLANVIDEPLTSAVLYGRVATRPPVNKDLLVFDAGAGTVDLAIVRYEHRDGMEAMTVLAEQGRCRAGADLDWALEKLILKKIAETTGVETENLVYAAYSSDVAAGRAIFQEECEQNKLALSQVPSIRWTKQRFLGHDHVEFVITQDEFADAARPIVQEIDGVVQAVLNEARYFVQDFDGVDIVLLVGGTSKVPFIRKCVERHCGGAVFEKSEGYFDELVATVRGVGFLKEFEDLILKRPPYTTELRVTLSSGATQTVLVHQAFDKLYPAWHTHFVAAPYAEIKKEFDAPIASVQVRFISPGGQIRSPSVQEFPHDCLSGESRILVRLDIQANLRIFGDRTTRTLRMPYFAQVGLRHVRPFAVTDLNIPDFPVDPG